METKTDLTALVPDFPETPSIEISRDVIINKLIREYSNKHQKKLILADFQCGKTNFVAQFCRLNKDHTISYFITDNPITHSKRNFLFTITQQISFLLDKKPPIAELSIIQLEPLVFSLTAELSALTINTGEKYFIAVDGIDKVIDSQAGSVASDFNLQSYANSPYLLYSCRTSNAGNLPDVFASYERVDLEYGLLFNKLDTENVLDTKLNKSTLDLIQEKSRGVPGYIAIIKNSINTIGVHDFSQIDLSEDLTKLTNEFIDKLFAKIDESTRAALFFSAICSRPVSLDTMETLVNKIGNFNREKLVRTELVYVDKTHIKFKNDLLRDAVGKLVGDDKNDLCRQILMVENEKAVKDEQLITALLSELGDYSPVVETLKHDYLVKVIESAGDLASAIRRARLAADLSIKNAEINDAIAWSWLVQVLDVFYLHTIRSNEIQALISIGDYQAALRKIYSLPESISRIRLLGRTYAQMKKRNEHVPIAALDELTFLIDNYDFDYSDKQLIRDLAVDLFEILPDKSMSLMEKVMAESERQNIIDATLAIHVLSENEEEAKVKDITDQSLEFVARLASSWLSSKTLAELMHEIEGFENKLAKEFMIRQWCIQNKESDELPFGIELWLDLIASETSIGISLKSLRQLSGLLINIKNEKDRENTIRRLEIPSFVALTTPWEEWIGFHLNIAEALFPINRSEALTRIENIYEKVNLEVIDLDIKVFCYARLFSTAIKTEINYAADIQSNLERVLSDLLGNSALQDKILNKTIKIVSMIDPNYAFEIAMRLNSTQRKAQAISTVLKSTFTTNLSFDMEALWSKAIVLLEPSEISSLLLSICSRLSENKSKPLPRNQSLLRKNIEHIENPLHKSEAQIYLATFWTNPEINPAKIIEMGIKNWGQENDLKNRIEKGFHFAEVLSETNLDEAKEFCKITQGLLLLPGAVLVSGALGTVFLNTVEIIIRSLDTQLLAEEDTTLKIINLAERIPSLIAKTYLYTQFAAKAYALGNYSLGSELVTSRLIKAIENCRSSSELKEILNITFSILSLHDLSYATSHIQIFDTNEKNIIVIRAILWLLTKRLINDGLNVETLNVSTDYPILRDKLLPLMDLLDIDHHIYVAIIVLTNTISNSVRENKLEKAQAFDLLQQLENLCTPKLPDPKNIQHLGYLLICQSRINRSRASISKLNRKGGGQSKVVIGEKWRELKSEISKIKNTADKAFILALVASDLFVWDPAGAEKLLNNAEETTKDVPALIDRANRFEVIADIWGDWRDEGKANFLYQKSMELAEQLDSFSRDQKIELLVQLMYKLNPDFADQVIQKYDKRLPNGSSASMQLRIQETKLIKDPQELVNSAPDSFLRHPRVIRSSAKSLLKKLLSGGGVVYGTNVLTEWLKETLNQDVNTARDVLIWIIESLHRQKTKTSEKRLFENLLNIGEIITYLVDWISPAKLEGVPVELSEMYPGLSNKMTIFYPEESHKAKSWVKRWIESNANEYVKICDPYFGPSELEFLQKLPASAKIFIITTNKKFEKSSTETELKRELASSWQQISPNTQMPSMLVVIVPSKLEISFHDRFIITKEKGLELGTSLTGLGLKLHKITELTKEDSRFIESKYFDPMLSPLFWSTKHDISPTYLSV